MREVVDRTSPHTLRVSDNERVFPPFPCSPEVDLILQFSSRLIADRIGCAATNRTACAMRNLKPTEMGGYTPTDQGAVGSEVWKAERRSGKGGRAHSRRRKQQLQESERIVTNLFEELNKKATHGVGCSDQGRILESRCHYYCHSGCGVGRGWKVRGAIDTPSRRGCQRCGCVRASRSLTMPIQISPAALLHHTHPTAVDLSHPAEVPTRSNRYDAYNYT